MPDLGRVPIFPAKEVAASPHSRPEPGTQRDVYQVQAALICGFLSHPVDDFTQNGCVAVIL